MTGPNIGVARLFRRLSFGKSALWIAAGAGTLAILLLAFSIVRDLELLKTAGADDVQWTLAQTEVEFLQFQNGLLEAQADGTANLTRVRQSFDIFFSRVDTLSKGQLYRPLDQIPDFRASVARLRDFLNKNAPAFDKPDLVLRPALGSIAEEAALLRPEVRQLAVSAVSYFAQAAENRRLSLALTLRRLALVATVLLGATALLAYHLNRLRNTGLAREDALQEANVRMRTVLSTALDAMIVSDGDGRILAFNPAAEAIFGYAAADALGQKIDMLLARPEPETGPGHRPRQVRVGGLGPIIGYGRHRLAARRADGSSFPAELAIQRAQGHDGEILIAFIRDISLQVAAEEELMRSRDSAVKGEKAKADFMAVMTHEIRTPLNGLLGSLALLARTRTTARQRTYIRSMEISGDLLMSHVNAVLDITRADAGHVTLSPRPTDLEALLQGIIDSQSSAAAEAGTTIGWRWSGAPLRWIMVDPGRLQQVVLNLVGNAIKFTRDGEVWIEARATRTSDTQAELQLSVIDTGVGIAPERQEAIFEDFVTSDTTYSRRTYGAGLGLGITRRLLSLMGGTISVESAPDKGSAFRVYLPVTVAKRSAPARTRARKAPSSIKPLSVLIVEDNDINRLVLREMLTDDGHRVTEARHGAAGVALAGREMFDLILVDLNMPVMDGWQAAIAIRSGGGASSASRIIAISANLPDATTQDRRDHGFDGFLSKPISAQTLISVLRADRSEPCSEKVSPASAGEDLSTAIPARDAAARQRRLEMLHGRFLDEVQQLLDQSSRMPLDYAALSDLSHRVLGSAAVLGQTSCHSALLLIEAAARGADADGVRAGRAALAAAAASSAH